MKVAVALLALPALASAFAPAPTFSRSSALSMANIVTGPKGSPAKSAEEDLELTRQVILDHISDENGSAPAPKEDEEKEE
mmetsp:Transcript_16797/g.22993  ORF Transcript_16797/g.22993 Transcript_16797/m.22993 type:complete len:80 (+) Transcript_16797:184-423(+)